MIYANKKPCQRAVAFIILGTIFGALSVVVMYRLFAVVPTMKVVEVVIGDKKAIFDAEVAQTSAQRRQGLMNRQDLCGTCGMLFVFPQSGIHAFWMKSTPLPLDIIWINNGQIVDIVRNTEPYSEKYIIPEKDAQQVLEILSGSVQRFDIKVGDSVRMRNK